LIETAGLGKTFRAGGQRLRVLADVTLSIGQGELVAIMGPSGSGKSTLLNILGCLDRPSAGRYRLAGSAVDGAGATELAALRNRHLGFVFQGFNLLPRLSAVENVALPLLYAGLPAVERRRRAVDLLERIGLAERLDHLPQQLSGGQQQRVAIARALANRPRLILADEPTGSLDSRSGAAILALFQDLNRSGVTIILVTHDASVAGCARRIVGLRDGRVVSDTVGPGGPDCAGRRGRAGDAAVDDARRAGDGAAVDEVRRAEDGAPRAPGQ
jgi:putative ABC transport system ATP-binding protein